MPQRDTRRGCDPAKLEAFIRDAGLSYRVNAKSWIFACPLCGKDQKLFISRATGYFKCWVCAEDPDRKFRGAPEYALTELTSQPVIAIKRALYGDGVVKATVFLDAKFNDLVDEDDDQLDLAELTETYTELPSTSWPLDAYRLDHKWATRGAEYMAGRGIPVELAMAYDVRYCPEKRAVMLPAWVGDKLVGWQYRITYEEHALAMLPALDGSLVETPVQNLKIWSDGEAGAWRDRCVMFANRLTDAEHCVLCEGPFDAMKAHLAGGNVASMGKAVSLGQVRWLLNAGVRKLYLALDPDAAREIEPLLSKFDGVPVHQVVLPSGVKDLGKMTLEAARDAILSAPMLGRGRIHVFFNT